MSKAFDDWWMEFPEIGCPAKKVARAAWDESRKIARREAIEAAAKMLENYSNEFNDPREEATIQGMISEVRALADEEK